MVLTLIWISIWYIIKHKSQDYPTIINNQAVSFPNVDTEASYQYLSGEQEVNCIFRNNSDYVITIGEEFYLEHKKDDKWYEIANIRGKRGNEGNWNAIAYNLESDTVKDIKISLNNFLKLKKVTIV